MYLFIFPSVVIILFVSILTVSTVEMLIKRLKTKKGCMKSINICFNQNPEKAKTTC